MYHTTKSLEAQEQRPGAGVFWCRKWRLGKAAMASRATLVLAQLNLVVEVTSHGAVTFPPPRNAIDGDKPPWNGAVPKTKLGGEPFGGWCPFPAGGNSTELSGANGQSCFWFS